MRLGPVMLDVGGLELNADDVERLQHPQVGGVILFARNFAAPLQLIQLCHSIRELRDPAAPHRRRPRGRPRAALPPRLHGHPADGASWASSGTAIPRRRSPPRAAAAS